MKKWISTVACAALIAAPLVSGASSASAQSHHSGVAGAGARSGSQGSGVRGGFQGSGFRGGFAGRGFRGGYWGGAPYFFGGAFLGLALGTAFADSWYDDYPAYYGYYAPYGVAPPPPYDDPWAYNYGPPPPPGAQAAPPQACGSWQWDAVHSKYNWIACPAN